MLEAWSSVLQCQEMVESLRGVVLYRVSRSLAMLSLEGINMVHMGHPWIPERGIVVKQQDQPLPYLWLPVSLEISWFICSYHDTVYHKVLEEGRQPMELPYSGLSSLKIGNQTNLFTHYPVSRILF